MGGSGRARPVGMGPGGGPCCCCMLSMAAKRSAQHCQAQLACAHTSMAIAASSQQVGAGSGPARGHMLQAHAGTDGVRLLLLQTAKLVRCRGIPGEWGKVAPCPAAARPPSGKRATGCPHGWTQPVQSSHTLVPGAPAQSAAVEPAVARSVPPWACTGVRHRRTGVRSCCVAQCQMPAAKVLT